MSIVTKAIQDETIYKILHRKHNNVLPIADSSFILSENGRRFIEEKFFRNMANGQKLYILVSVLYEIKKKASENSQIANEAKLALLFLKKHMDKIVIAGKHNDGSFADPYFKAISCLKGIDYHIVLLIEDKGLTSALQKDYFNNSDFMHHKKSLSFISLLSGKIVTLHENDFRPDKHNVKTSTDSKTTAKPKENHKSASEHAYKIPDSGFRLNMPTVYTENRMPCHLKKHIGGGARARIFETSNGMAAKIIHPSINQDAYTGFVERLLRLTELRLDHENIVFVKEILYDTSDNGRLPIGYLMPKIENAVTLHELLCTSEYISINDRVKICCDVINAIAYLQTASIKLPDFRPDNILVQSNGETLKTFLVDCDGFQVPNTQKETSQNELFDSPKFVKNSESFSFAIMSFLILTNVHPYLCRFASIRENIEKLEFRYHDGRGNSPQADRIFKSLTEELQAAYIRALKNGDPPSITEWKQLFEQFDRQLNEIKVKKSLWKKWFT